MIFKYLYLFSKKTSWDELAFDRDETRFERDETPPFRVLIRISLSILHHTPTTKTCYAATQLYCVSIKR